MFCCLKLEMIESNAPKLSIFYYAGDPICTSVGDALHVRRVDFRHDHSPGALYYARTKLPLIVPNVRTLVLSTRAEVSLILPKHFIVLQIKSVISYVYCTKLLILGIYN